MSRDLKKIFENIDPDVKVLIDPMVDEVLFLESKLKDLKQYPFLVANPKNASQQRVTPAGKQYKEFLQQYSNCIKVLSSVLTKNGEEEESPLRTYLKSLEKRGG